MRRFKIAREFCSIRDVALLGGSSRANPPYNVTLVTVPELLNAPVGTQWHANNETGEGRDSVNTTARLLNRNQNAVVLHIYRWGETDDVFPKYWEDDKLLVLFIKEEPHHEHKNARTHQRTDAGTLQFDASAS